MGQIKESHYKGFVSKGAICFVIEAGSGDDVQELLDEGAGLVLATESDAQLADQLMERFIAEKRVLVEHRDLWNDTDNITLSDLKRAYGHPDFIILYKRK